MLSNFIQIFFYILYYPDFNQISSRYINIKILSKFYPYFIQIKPDLIVFKVISVGLWGGLKIWGDKQ